MNTTHNSEAIVDITQQGSIDDQAAVWVAKLDSDQPAPETIAAFKAWINQSADHRKAFEDHVDVWDQLNTLAELVPPRPQATLKPRWFFVPFATPWAMACTTILLAVAVMLFQTVNGYGSARYTTAIGEQASFTLPDGSTALLNTDSQIAVRYTDNSRHIQLLYGEAHFDVVKKPHQPFEVFAGQGLVRAVGTAFSVYLRQDDVEVVVTEGIVEIDTVAPAEAAIVEEPLAPPPQVAAGNQATYDRHTATHILLAEMQKLEQKTAWHQGLLIFDDEPLEQVVAEVGRYTQTKIIIPEQQIRQLKVGGQFKVGDTEAMFEALKVSFNLQVRIVSDDLVYLEKNNP